MAEKPAAIRTNAADALLKALEHLPVAVVSDTIDTLGLPNTVLRGVARMAGRRIVGRARTISRELAPSNVTQADIDPELGMGTQVLIDSCKPDDVIVIGARGDRDYAVWGDNMATRASAVGVRGMVTDGAVRDIDQMDDLGIAVFAGATTPRQAFKRLLTLSINEPVFCGGVRVRSGDIIIADGDGVVVIGAEHADKVAAKAAEIHAIENTMQDFLREGNELVAAVKKFKQR